MSNETPIETTGACETKAAPSEVRAAMTQFLKTFKDFKDANDARLDAIEQRAGDVLLEEKVERINGALDEHKSAIDRLALSARRPGLGVRPAVAGVRF